MGFSFSGADIDPSGSMVSEMLPPSLGWSHNQTLFDCPDVFCNLMEEIGSPPDWFPPPPPLPPYLVQLLSENRSLIEEGTDNCNMCHLFSNPTDSELVVVPGPEFKPADSWQSLLIGSVLGSTILCIILLFILVKFRKWKLLPSSVCGLDVFPESPMSGQKATPPSENCLSPVVNEKSPQSIITSFPTKTSIPSKYWRRSDENAGSHTGMVDPRMSETDEYTNIPEGSSCGSIPVYAELDAAGVTINRSQIPSSLVMGSQSPYSLHTYSEVTDAMRMGCLGSPTALLPDASYDNVAYLLSTNVNHYQGRSFRQQRSGLGHLGSTAPLLAPPQQMIPGSPLTYLTGGRSHKKSRPTYAHHTPQLNTQTQHLQQQSIQFESDPHYMSSHPEAVYSDYPLHPQSLSTIRVPYGINYKENPKRPLPAVPGVRL